MRILHVTESFAGGGIETTFLHMLRAFRTIAPRIRHEVLAFAGGPLEAAYRQAADVVFVAPEWQAVTACRARSADLVHVLFDRCAYRLIPDLIAVDPVPIVYGKGYDLAAMYRANEGLRWQADESLLVAATATTFTTRSLANQYNVPAGPSIVLGKAADVRRFERLLPPSPATPPCIVCVANLHPRKRVGDLVDALARVRALVPAATLRLVGSGDDAVRAALVERARAVGVEDAVSFAGHVADVAGEMSGARVVALPSSCEGVPTVLLEGMAAGRPVVATRSGHVASIVTDGIEGFLVPIGDVAGLADRLTRLLRDPALAERMSEAARRRAARHDVSRVAAALLDVLVAAVPTRPFIAAGGR